MKILLIIPLLFMFGCACYKEYLAIKPGVPFYDKNVPMKCEFASNAKGWHDE